MVRQYGQDPNEVDYSGTAAANPKNTPMPKREDPAPTTEEVERFHRNAEVDVKATSIHHTLGPGEFQAASGSHRHDGGDSPLILDGYVLVGNMSNPASMLPSIVQCLVRLGAKNSTS